MKEATKQQYDALIMAAREKLRYEAAMKEYRELSPMRRLFTRAPKDLTPNLSFSQLNDILSDTFRRAHPDLNRYTPGKKGPHSYGFHFSVQIGRDGELQGCVKTQAPTGGTFGSGTFHEEKKEFRKGYGLVDEFQHDDDEKQEIVNRNYAASRALSSRHKDEIFTNFYKRVDDICFNEFRRIPSLGDPGLGQNPNLVKRYVAKAVADTAIEKEINREAETFKRPTANIETLQDYAEIISKVDRIQQAVISDHFEKINDLVPMEFDYQHKLDIADYYYTNAVVKRDHFEQEKMADLLLESRPETEHRRPSMEEIVDYGLRKISSPRENPAAKVAEAALLEGYSMPVVEAVLARRGLSDSSTHDLVNKGRKAAEKALCESFIEKVSSPDFKRSSVPIIPRVRDAVYDVWNKSIGKLYDDMVQTEDMAIRSEQKRSEIKAQALVERKQPERAAGVSIFNWSDGKVNINRPGAEPLIVDGISAEKEGFHIVKKDGKFNYLGKDGELLCKNWLDKAGEFEGGIAECVIGKSFFEINTKGECITKKTLVQENVEKGMKI